MKALRMLLKLKGMVVVGCVLTSLAASPAAATTSVQVVDEPINAVCSSISSPHTTQGCSVKFRGTVTWQAWAFVWFDEATCIVELDMRVSGTGVLAVDSMQLFDGDSNCDGVGGTAPVTGCDFPWEGSMERVSSTKANAKLAICMNLPEIDVAGATATFPIIEGSLEELYIEFINTTVGAVVRLNGTLYMVVGSWSSYTEIHIN